MSPRLRVGRTSQLGQLHTVSTRYSGPRATHTCSVEVKRFWTSVRSFSSRTSSQHCRFIRNHFSRNPLTPSSHTRYSLRNWISEVSERQTYFCSLCSARSGISNARDELMPRSSRNVSNSACTASSRLSNWVSTGVSAARGRRGTYVGSNVEASSLPVTLRGEIVCDRSVVVERDVVNREQSIYVVSASFHPPRLDLDAMRRGDGE